MKQRLLCLMVALSFSIASSVFAQNPQPQNPQRGISIVSNSNIWGNYHALIIGINDYKEWPRLKTAVKDASVIRDVLVSRYGFAEKNVIFRTDREASRHQITRDLRYLAKSMRKNDNLFIYYAGHGQLDDFTGDGYWIPAEGTLKDPSTWVANSYIKAVLSSEKLQAKNVVVIADSCYSGSMLRGGPSLMSLDDRRYREKLVAKASLRSRQVISSGGVEPVADGGAEGHSLFAFYLIDALRNNDREVIDLENLFHTRVWKPVTEIGNQRPNVGRLKTPMDQDGQFILYNAALARTRTKLRQPVSGKTEKAHIAGTAANSAPQNINAEEETWQIVKSSTDLEDYTIFLEAYPDSRFKTAARLKIQQLKRKQNARRMSASVAPAVVEQSARNGRRKAQDRYELALFPIKVKTDWGFADTWQTRVIRIIAAMSEKDERLDFRLSFKKVPGITDGVKLFSESDNKKENQIWKKERLFSKYEPDWQQIKKTGLKFDADLAMVISIDISLDSTADIYLYDYKHDKTYSREKASISRRNLPRSMQRVLVDIMKEYFRNQ